MRLHGFVEVNETKKLNLVIGAVFKASLAVPPIRPSANDSFRFVVGLQTIDAGKLLTDTVLLASFNESIVIRSFRFRTVIRINIVDLIAALGNVSFFKKGSGAVLSFVGGNIGIQLPGEIIDDHKQIIMRLVGGLPF